MAIDPQEVLERPVKVHLQTWIVVIVHTYPFSPRASSHLREQSIANKHLLVHQLCILFSTHSNHRRGLPGPAYCCPHRRRFADPMVQPVH